MILSVVTIVYNDLSGLRETISSLEAACRTLPAIDEVEHAIVDGGSRDGTREFLAHHAATTPISTRYISEPDDGIYAAMNKGVALSRGEFVLFINAGDRLHQEVDMVRVLAEVTASRRDAEAAGVAFASVMQFPNLGVDIKARAVDPRSPRMPTVHQSMIYKREVLEQILFDNSYKICGDFENFARIQQAGLLFRPVDAPLSAFSPGGRSSQMPVLLYRESLAVAFSRYPLGVAAKLRCAGRLAASLLLFQLIYRFTRLWHHLATGREK